MRGAQKCHPLIAKNQDACIRSVIVTFRGWQGLLAYGCHTFVVIVDPKNVQVNN